MAKMTQDEIDFSPYNQWKPYHKITFIGYEFTINGKDIEFEDRVRPENLGVKDGDMYVVKIQDNKVILERAEFI